MTRTQLILLIIALILICFIGIFMCYDEPKEASVEIDNIETTNFGKSALIEIGNLLYYDKSTYIVYWWNGRSIGERATTPTPYISSNGLPYKYNPDTNSFEEITTHYKNTVVSVAS